MDGGVLTDATDVGTALRHDVCQALLAYSGEMPGGGLLGRRLSQAEATLLAAELAYRLGPMVGGRYVTLADMRAERDAAIWREFTGRNHASLMRKFKVSKALLYSILARRRRGSGMNEWTDYAR